MTDMDFTSAEYDFLVLDGAIGTEIKKRIQNERNLYSDRLLCGSVYFSGHEHVVMDVHNSYLETGADVILTNSYKLFPRSMAEDKGLSEQEALAVIRRTAEDAVRARDTYWEAQGDKAGHIKPLVAACTAPFDSQWENADAFHGAKVAEFSLEEIGAAHRPKAEALLAGGAELLAFETVASQKEGEALAGLMNQLQAKAWVCFTCKDDTHVGHGEPFRDAVMTSLKSDNIIGVGLNCSRPQHVTNLLKQIPAEVKQRKRIVVYPNSGEVWDPLKQDWVGSAESVPLYKYVSEWLENGANWIGGCCNTGPEDIAKVREEVLKYRKK